ncbi:DNA repair endonuclease XPF-like isoform X2 [Prorops nasuta]
MLDYENQMFLEILQEDGLVVVAKGLGLETVVGNIIKVYQDPGNLVLVLGTIDHDERYFIEMVAELGSSTLPKVINAEILSDERQLMYLEGGVIFVSGRILVVDLLKNRVPLHLITGIIVYRAHSIINSYQEAFALRLYRQQNKTGFIKAFTSSALAFTVGFGQIERVMKSLFVKKLYLWPRFHSVVNKSLSNHTPEVIELHVKITPKMSNIQTALLDLMNYIIKEIKCHNKYLDMDDLTVENALTRKFHKQLQSQLDPIWNQLSSATKQLVTDLKTLRTFLTALTYEDSVSFYAMLNRLRTMDYAMKTSSWIMLDPVDTLFLNAKERIYNIKNELKPEMNPKWSALSEIIQEVKRDHSEQFEPGHPKKILILVRDNNTCRQIKNYLTRGANEFLRDEVLRKLPQNKNLTKKPKISNNAEEGSNNEDPDEETIEEYQDTYVLTLTQTNVMESQSKEHSEEGHEDTLFEKCSQIENLDLTAITADDPIIIIQTFKKGGDPMSLKRTLKETMPNYIVLYVADISTIRQLEVHQNSHPYIKLKIFFLVYGGSVEEQEYLTSLRREKAAFHMLINTKTTMVVPEDQDGKSNDCLALAAEAGSSTEENTRKGGLSDQPRSIPKVIVDIREFRSELPALLHKRGIEVEPVTITVGDYILSPDICVERKSVSDLIMSLMSGRLYNQALAMKRYYSKPMLLIEFDQNKPFSLQGHYFFNKDMKSEVVTKKLQLLTIHFPKLKLVWSPSPMATTQLFEELKEGKEQPDGVKAAQIGVGENEEENKDMLDKYNTGIYDFMMKLPGVHSKNIHRILQKGKSLPHLITLSQDELTTILENKSDAQLLFNALHNEVKMSEDIPSSTSKVAWKGRGKPFFAKPKK